MIRKRGPMCHPDKPRGWRPLCQCGCGQQVKRRKHRYLVGHGVAEIRSKAGAKGRRIAMLRSQHRVFAAVFSELETRYGNRLTKDALYWAFSKVRLQAWECGYRACESKHLRRRMRTAA